MPSVHTRGRNRSPVDDSESVKEAELTTTGEAELIETSPTNTEDQDSYFRDLAFNEEYMEILVHPSSSEHDTARLVQVGVNGEKCYIMRGHAQKVKRKFVERLVWAKPDFIHAEGTRNIQTGLEKNKITKHQVSKYNFEVLDDPNPNGPRWLEQLRQKARV